MLNNLRIRYRPFLFPSCF